MVALTGYSHSTIAKVETGRQHVPHAFWERADAVLRTGGTLAAANDELNAVTRQGLRTAARQVSKERQAGQWQLRLNAAIAAPAVHGDEDLDPQARFGQMAWPTGFTPPVLTGGKRLRPWRNAAAPRNAGLDRDGLPQRVLFLSDDNDQRLISAALDGTHCIRQRYWMRRATLS
jgi:hypothetical protein